MQVFALLFESQFGADPVAMGHDGVGRKVQDGRDLLGIPPLFDQMGHLQFSG